MRSLAYSLLVVAAASAGEAPVLAKVVPPAGAVSVEAWAYYFGKLTGQPDDTLKQAANELYRTYDYENNEWTRPTAPASGLTAYRNNPPRRYNWNYKTSGSLSWCLSDVRWMR